MAMNLIKKIGLIGIGATIAVMTHPSIAQARSAGAGIGYNSSVDTSYCSAVLIATNPNSRINVREGSGVNYETIHYGMPGDSVDFLNRDGNPKEIMVEEDANGVKWYQIGFPESSAYGWVRRDFVRQTECR
jgi:hypothetical protein